MLGFLDVSAESLPDQRGLTPSLDGGSVTERDGDVLVDINGRPNHAYMLTHTNIVVSREKKKQINLSKYWYLLSLLVY